MSFEDKSIVCCDCRATFTFTAGEQEFYETKGFTNEPRRCQSCRRDKKAQRSGMGSNSYADRY
ncbi:zinc-ribbon domain-containing protein [Chloroflexota bacterium]